MDLKQFIRSVPDFPKPGVLFRDISPLLLDAPALQEVISTWTLNYRNKGITKIAGIEARGFCFAVPLALELQLGFVPLRKPGKLPWCTFKETYKLEYGTNTLELHSDALSSTDQVLIVDDVLATGGTAAAAARLVEKSGAKVSGLAFLIELLELNGRKQLGEYEVRALITYGSANQVK